MTVAILITIVILVCIIIALMAYNISIHKKITKFSNISEKINGLNVLQNFMDTIGEYSSVEEKIEKIINKKIKANKNLSRNNLILKLKSYLISLGYESSMVVEMLNLVDFEENNSILEKEYQKEYKKLNKKYNGKELENKIKYNLYKKGFSLNDIDKIQNKY